jgi:choline dehydrogenase-like flavoprotein
VETAKLLLLSGVGSNAELKDLGIDAVINLPGIGGNFHDHYPLFMNCIMSPGSDFSDRLDFQHDRERVDAAREQWLRD